MIPTYGRPAQLANCLQSLVELDYTRGSFEVIVVDDGGDPSPYALVETITRKLDVELVTLFHAGPAAARNAGARQARGEFLAFTDDDCAPTRCWLQELAKIFTVARGDMVGGLTINALPNNLFAEASQALVGYLHSYCNVTSGETRFLTSNNMALSTERFHDVGGFDPTLLRAAGEDREFCDRWLHRGYHITHSPQANVRHAHPLMLRRFWRQHFNYGHAAYYYHLIRAQRTGKALSVEPARFYSNLLRYPFSQQLRRRAIVVSAPMALSQVTNAIGIIAGWAAAKCRPERS